MTYARKHQFDPLNPEQWYSQSKSKILTSKVREGGREGTGRGGRRGEEEREEGAGEGGEVDGVGERDRGGEKEGRGGDERRNVYSFGLQGAHRVLAYHQGSISKALKDLFPHITFEPSRLKNYGNSSSPLRSAVSLVIKTSTAAKVVMQQEHEKRKKWMENYAKERGFDPHAPENWYSETIAKISSVKVLFLSPSSSFSLLSSLPSPPFLLLSLPLPSLYSFLRKGGSTVLGHFKLSLSSALMHLFPHIGLEKGRFHRARKFPLLLLLTSSFLSPSSFQIEASLPLSSNPLL